MKPGLINRIFNIKGKQKFQDAALEIFRYQSEMNPVYNSFIHSLSQDHRTIEEPRNIPFLPVQFFKNHRIITGNLPAVVIFESSGTTGSDVSRHFVADTGIYERSFLQTFSLFYGNPADYLIAALLPSYDERENSSLVYMADRLIKNSKNRLSGFYKENIPEMLLNINKEKARGRKIILIGVSFALLDIAEKFSPDLSGIIIMETGGMKGRRKEITREELHSVLMKKFNTGAIHSEYGMTELLSQAYSKADGVFYTPPWMKILIRDPQDPLSIIDEPGVTGGINIIDLANIDSCSFIATGDLGKLHDDGGFEVLGRFDDSDIRGCNLLIG